MQSLRNVVINGAVIFALLFGLTLSATAAEPTFEEVKALQAFEEIKVLAEKGDSFYQAYLGSYYAQGRGVRQDNSKAFYWYQKSAKQGNDFG